jgi:hypothetical protein
VTHQGPAVTKIAGKQAPNERCSWAEKAEVQRPIDFCRALHCCKRAFLLHT